VSSEVNIDIGYDKTNNNIKIRLESQLLDLVHEDHQDIGVTTKAEYLTFYSLFYPQLQALFDKKYASAILNEKVFKELFTDISDLLKDHSFKFAAEITEKELNAFNSSLFKMEHQNIHTPTLYKALKMRDFVSVPSYIDIFPDGVVIEEEGMEIIKNVLKTTTEYSKSYYVDIIDQQARQIHQLELEIKKLKKGEDND